MLGQLFLAESFLAFPSLLLRLSVIFQIQNQYYIGWPKSAWKVLRKNIKLDSNVFVNFWISREVEEDWILVEEIYRIWFAESKLIPRNINSKHFSYLVETEQNLVNEINRYLLNHVSNFLAPLQNIVSPLFTLLQNKQYF